MRLTGGLIVPVALIATGLLFSTAEAAEEHATIARLASQALLLDAQQNSDRVIAVGERGHILISSDSGVTWRQAPVPTRNTLTAVAFADESHVVAVGHEGTILRSQDSGESWAWIENGAGAESSFLDVIFVSPSKGFAIGAYGVFFDTGDGGLSWTQRSISDEGFHYNRIARGRDGTLYIVGEAGTVLRSMDMGGTWDPIPTPYEGSFFGFLDLRGGVQLIFGLRGHVFRSKTQGDEWDQVELPVPTLVMSGAELPDGRVLLAGQTGNFLLSSDEGKTFDVWHWGATTGIAEVLPVPGGGLLVFGEAGAKRIQVPDAKTGPQR